MPSILSSLFRLTRMPGCRLPRRPRRTEPQNRNPSGYPGMFTSAEQQARFIEVLGPALRAAHLNTVILAYDHNRSMHPGDIASTPTGEVPETEYPDPECCPIPRPAQWVYGRCHHCYFGRPEPPADDVARAVPGRAHLLHRVLVDPTARTTPLQVFSDTLRFHARNLTIGTTPETGRRRSSPSTWPSTRPAVRTSAAVGPAAA